MEQKFKLSHVVLYAKGWYKKTDDIWEDLRKILLLDGYESYDKMDVYSILITAVQDSNIYRWSELKEVLNGIHPFNCWKYGYFVQENKDWAGKDYKIYEYDMPTAFVYYVISNLKFIDSKFWNPTFPRILKYPKGTDVTISKIYEFFIKNKT